MGRAVGFAALTLAVASLWMLAWPATPISQLAPFPHARHQRIGCAVCHSGVETAARAGLPDLGLCARCHATAPQGFSAEIWPATATTPGARDRASPWVRVTRVPDHVFFSHRRHVAVAALECASCHGTVTDAVDPLTRPARRLDMDGCIRCHRRENVSDDCLTCHR